MDLSNNFKQFQQSRIIHLLLAIVFFTSGVFVNLLQCILYLTLRHVNKDLYRKINWYLCYCIYSQLVFLGDWWSNTKVIIYSDKKEFDKYFGKEHSYCVMNHSYEVDWLIGWMVCERLRLLGNCKAYAKKVTQYMPVLGWAWKFAEFVFLERSFDKDKDIICRQINELVAHPDPIWLLLFPEGTRFTPKKHEASLEFARKNNLPELKHHLLPRTKGFVASLPSMRGKMPAVYNVEVAYKKDEPVKPTMTNILMGESLTAHMYFKRIPMEDLPETEKEQEEFLRDMFVEKDKMRESFFQTGDFFATSGVPKVECFELPRRIFPLLNILFWCVSTLIPISYYLLRLLFNGDFICFSIVAGLLGAFLLLLNKIIGMSEIDKGSSYGTGNVLRKDQ